MNSRFARILWIMVLLTGLFTTNRTIAQAPKPPAKPKVQPAKPKPVTPKTTPAKPKPVVKPTTTTKPATTKPATVKQTAPAKPAIKTPGKPGTSTTTVKKTIPPKPKPAVAVVPKTTPQKPLAKDTVNKAIVAAPLPAAVVKDSINAAKAQWAWIATNAGTVKEDTLFINKPVVQASADYVFYLLAGIVLLLGLIRSRFPKYYTDLFGLFFKGSFRQKAIRDRLLENALPSVMLNLLFFCTGGFFLYYLSAYYDVDYKGRFWAGLGFWIALLLTIYVGKLTLLKLMGWLFQIQETSNTYSFIVFMVNKVMGVALIPVVVLMALGPASYKPVLITISAFLLGFLFLYRYAISYPSIRSSVRVNQFHFFLYLCAFEIIPLLVIYKALTMYFQNPI